MTNDNVAERLAKVEERSRSNTHRLDNVEKNTDNIHEMSTKVTLLAEKVGQLVDRLDKSFESQKTQGERIGKVEDAVLLLQQNSKALEEHEKRLDAIEKEPAAKWNKAVWVVISAVILAAVGFALAKIF